MKTIKTILIAATLICASVVSSLSAQQAAQPAQQHEFPVAKGDSVMIRTECVKYSTGERPSVWVWDKVHTVRQLGTKRFSDGVLLMNIYSWICDTCLINVNGHAEEAAKEASIAQAEQKAAFESGNPEAMRAAKEEAAIAAADSAFRAKEEAAPVDTVPAGPIVEQAKADSIASQQKFKHNYNRFTIGLRGGASALMHHTNMDDSKWTCGGDVVLDLQYAHYWAKDGRPVDLGLIVGVGVGYQQSGMNTDAALSYFKRPDVGSYNINYLTWVQDIKETDHQLQLEVPLMFSMIHDNGFFFNFGPKFMIPVYTPYKMSVNEDKTFVGAYFEKTGITMVNNPVTGVYEGQQPEEKNGIQFNINVMLTAEIGYEWILKSGNSLGLGAYANYCVYNTYKNTPNSEGLFSLTAPTETDKAHLNVLSATHAYADKLSFFDAGIKLAYHFNWPKKRSNKDSKLF